MNAILKCKGTW